MTHLVNGWWDRGAYLERGMWTITRHRTEFGVWYRLYHGKVDMGAFDSVAAAQGAYDGYTERKQCENTRTT